MRTFDCDERGILDKTHLRFFTRRSFLRIVSLCQFEAGRSLAPAFPGTAEPFSRSAEAAPGRTAVEFVIEPRV